jgi:hypothetical protein
MTTLLLHETMSPPRRTFHDDDVAAQRLRPQPHDVYHIAHLLLEKDLRLGPLQYPHQKANQTNRTASPGADEQPDNPPIALESGDRRIGGYASLTSLLSGLSLLFLQGPLVFGHNLFYLDAPAVLVLYLDAPARQVKTQTRVFLKSNKTRFFNPPAGSKKTPGTTRERIWAPLFSKDLTCAH